MKAKKYTLALTIYLENGTEKKVEWEFDKLYTHEERGTIKHRNEAGECTNIEPNGYRRLMIKAWTNGKDWDDFIKEEYKRSQLPTTKVVGLSSDTQRKS